MIRLVLKSLIGNFFFFTIKFKSFKKLYTFFFHLFLINRGYCADWEYLINKSNNRLFKGENLFIKKLSKIRIKKCIDVGANIGEYSEQLILNKIDKVLAFEPIRECFLKLNKLKNKYPKQLELYNKGLSNTKKKCELFYEKGKSEMASLEIINDTLKKNTLKEIIELEKLDNFINDSNFQNIDFIKIDVEGHELNVINGSTEFIKKNDIKIIQIEFNWHHLLSKNTIFEISNNLKNYDVGQLNLLNGKIKILDPKSYLSNIYMLSNFIFINKKIVNNNSYKILFE